MSSLKEILNTKKICKSIWFMRQAGRYLPEFRKIRSENKNFIQLCLNSELSSEITLQPIKRFDLDSAIIFSDILMVPYALGQKVEFIKNMGPKLEDFNLKNFLNNDKISFTQKLHPVYKAIQKSRERLDKNKLDYDKVRSKEFEVNLILDKLNDYLCTHIENQVNAGADVVQIFDSWAGLITPNDLPNYCFIPNLKIVNFCKNKKIPVICFPRGIGEKYKEFNNVVKPDGINLDYGIDPHWAKENLINVTIQGGLDPKILLSSEQEINKAAKKYLEIFGGMPYIFNLGHGLLPETDPDKVKKLIKFYREY